MATLRYSKIYISEARLHNLCKVSGYFKYVATSILRVSESRFEIKVPTVPGGIHMFTTGTFITCMYHLAYYNKPKQVVNAPLLEVLKAGLFLLVDSWVYSTLNSS